MLEVNWGLINVSRPIDRELVWVYDSEWGVAAAQYVAEFNAFRTLTGEPCLSRVTHWAPLDLPDEPPDPPKSSPRGNLSPFEGTRIDPATFKEQKLKDMNSIAAAIDKWNSALQEFLESLN